MPSPVCSVCGRRHRAGRTHADVIATNLRGSARANGYEITVAARDALLDRQGHRCAVCLRPFRTPVWHLVCTFDVRTLRGSRIKSPNVDHNHITGQVRGLLCRHCNRELVKYADQHPDWMLRAVEYVRRATLDV